MTEQEIETLGQEAIDLVCDVVFDVSGVQIESCDDTDALESDIGIEEYHLDIIATALSAETRQNIDLSSRPLFLGGVVHEVFQALKANRSALV